MSDLFGGLFQGSVDDIPDEGGYNDNPPDGVYEASIKDIYPKEGSTKYPDKKWMFVEYLLTNTGETKAELFGMPRDPAHPTEDEAKKLNFFVRRLGDLGVPRDKIQTTSTDSLIGLDVVITLRTKGEYQNVTRVDLAGPAEATPAEPARQEPVRAAGTAARQPQQRVQRANPYSR